MKSKECIAPGCEKPNWAGGYCRGHQALREDGGIRKVQNFPKFPRKSKGLRKLSKKKKDNRWREIEETKEMHQFFLDYWAKTPVKVCRSCGVWLGNEPRTYMFDHLLEKEKYPEFKYEEDNIFLCCLECHDAKNKGYPKLKHEEAIQRAREKYLT